MSSNDELTPPQWMDKKWLEKVIRHDQKDPKAELHYFKIKPAAKPGDHFASVLFRCGLSYSSKFGENKAVSWVVKTIPNEDGFKKEMLMNSPLFKTEMAMYGEVLPQMETLLKSVGDNTKLCPKLIYQSNDPVPIIVLEDLDIDEFVMHRTPPEDYDDSKAIFQRLAKFHAASYFMMNEQTEDFSEMNFCVFGIEDKSVTDTIFGDSIELFTEEVKTWPGYENYIPKLENLKQTFREKGIKTYTPNKPGDGYNVLNHGDFHIKNLLFQEDEDEGQEFIFLDFQVCVLASPAIDLLYAMQNMISMQNRLEHREDIISYYYQEFVSTLKALGFLKAIPTILDLQVELLKNGGLELMLAICFKPFMFIDPTKINLHELVENNETGKLKQMLFANPDYHEFIQAELPRCLYNGFI